VAQVADPATLPGDKRWALIVDGLFGIGLTRPITGEFARLVDYANQQSCPILALDVPSGIDADTGRVLGHAVRATHTLTFIALKRGCSRSMGPITAARFAWRSSGWMPRAWCGLRPGWPARSCSPRTQAAAAQLP